MDDSRHLIFSSHYKEDRNSKSHSNPSFLFNLSFYLIPPIKNLSSLVYGPIIPYKGRKVKK